MGELEVAGAIKIGVVEVDAVEGEEVRVEVPFVGEDPDDLLGAFLPPVIG